MLALECQRRAFGAPIGGATVPFEAACEVVATRLVSLPFCCLQLTHHPPFCCLQLAHLEVDNLFEIGQAHHPPSSGSGDAALDAAVAAAAALDTRPGAGAEGGLALALARRPSFRCLILTASDDDWWAHGAAAAVALRLQRLRPNVVVEMAPAGGAERDGCWW